MALLIFLNLFNIATSFAQSETVIAQEYDKAFYSQNYKVALLLIDTLGLMDSENLAYKRERLKMLALLGLKNDFVKEFNKLREAESDGHYDHSTILINFPDLPPEFLELMGEEAKKNNDQKFLQKFFPDITVAKNDLFKNFIPAEANKPAFGSLKTFSLTGR